jgi:hypothetical protein
MFTVKDILLPVKRALGNCDDETAFDRIDRAVEILCTESDWDPTRGFVDLCVDKDRCITLPDEVESILAINIGGHPAQGHNMWFQFHLNGPGAGCHEGCNFDWFDRGTFPVITDPTKPFQIVAQLETDLDNNVPIRVYAYDEFDRWITTIEDGQAMDGFLVPTAFGVSVPNPAAPLVKRVVRVSKGPSKGAIILSTLDFDSASNTGTLLGYYRPYELEPQYRRVRLSKHCTWARIAYKRKYFKLIRETDLVPLHSAQAVVLMCQALAKFDNDRLEDGQNYWKTAVALLIKKQQSISPPVGPSIQFADRNLIADKSDRLE